MSNPMSYTDESTNNVSERFRATDADIIFKSEDGILFYIHKKYLEANTGGFPPAEFQVLGETVSLTGTSTVLELLFRFIYPARHPDLASIEFDILEPLSEAAEKYEVYSAMNICKIRMWSVLPEHAEPIIAYAMKHDYPDLIGDAAPLLLNKPLEEIVIKMPPDYIIPWMLYYAKWNKCLQSAVSYRTFGDLYLTSCSHTSYKEWTACSGCQSPLEGLIVKIIMSLTRGVVALRDLDSVFNDPNLGCCNTSISGLKAWREKVEADISQIPNFATFL